MSRSYARGRHRQGSWERQQTLADLALGYPASAIGTTKSYLRKNEAVMKEFMLAYLEAIHGLRELTDALLP